MSQLRAGEQAKLIRQLRREGYGPASAALSLPVLLDHPDFNEAETAEQVVEIIARLGSSRRILAHYGEETGHVAFLLVIPF